MPPSPLIPKNRRGVRFLLELRRDPLRYFTELARREGPFAWIGLMGKPVLMLNDATAIGHVLEENPANYWKGDVNKVLAPLLADGIFLSEGPQWRRQRQEAISSFATPRLSEMLPLIEGTIAEMLDQWAISARRGEAIDLGAEMTRLTLDIFLRSLFHVRAPDVARDLRDSLGMLLREAEARIWAPISLPQKWVLALPRYRAAMRLMHQTVEHLINERRTNPSHPDDLLSKLIENYADTPEEQRLLRQQILSFMLSGHETTAHGLTWSLLHVAQSAEYQNRLHAEASSALSGPMQDLEQFRALGFSQNLFNEALRLYPPVWTFSREAFADDRIPLSDGSFVDLPARGVAMLCVYAVHRNPDYWPDPDRFDPARFEAEASQTRPRFAWFPFGGGPRLCLGQRFATVESTLTLSMIAQRIEIEWVGKKQIKPEPIITLRPSEKIFLKLREREQQK